MFVQKEIQDNNSILFALFILILCVNAIFLFIWVLRFVVVIARVYSHILSKLPCMCFKKLSIKNYHEDLKDLKKKWAKTSLRY